jgi:cell division protein FtsL
MTPIDGAELPDVELPEIAHPEDAYEVGGPVRRPHLRVAPTVSHGVLRRRRRARFAVFGVAAISAASMFLLVAFHVFAVQSAFQLNKLDQQLSAEQRRYAQLRSEVDEASAPETVARKAADLGMQRSRNVYILTPNAPDFGAKSELPAPPPTPADALAPPDSGP